MLAVQNSAKADVPVIFTELGCDAVTNGADMQAHALVKAYMMGIAQGVACIQWFEGKDGDSGPLGLLDRKGIPRPAFAAMARMIQHLGQHPMYLGWTLLNEKHYAFAFQGTKGTVLITWAHGKTTDEIHFAKPVRWQIDDAQFANYWGYNFALESDGNQYNKYFLQSVTVTKRSK